MKIRLFVDGQEVSLETLAQSIRAKSGLGPVLTDPALSEALPEECTILWHCAYEEQMRISTPGMGEEYCHIAPYQCSTVADVVHHYRVWLAKVTADAENKIEKETNRRSAVAEAFNEVCTIEAGRFVAEKVPDIPREHLHREDIVFAEDGITPELVVLQVRNPDDVVLIGEFTKEAPEVVVWYENGMPHHITRTPSSQ